MTAKQNHDANMNSLMSSHGHGNSYGGGQYQKHVPQAYRSHRDPHQRHVPNTMSYREAPRSPPRHEAPAKQDFDDFDPPSPEPPCGYEDDRIQNDLLDEICSDIGIKDAIDLDVFDFDTHTDQYIINQSKLPDDLDSIEHTLAFGQYPNQQDQHRSHGPGHTHLPPLGDQNKPSSSAPGQDRATKTGADIGKNSSESIASPTISSSCNPGTSGNTGSNSRPASVDSVAADSPAVHSTSTQVSSKSNMSTGEVRSESQSSYKYGGVNQPMGCNNSPVPSPAYSHSSMGPPSVGPPSVESNHGGKTMPKSETCSTPINSCTSKLHPSSQPTSTPAGHGYSSVSHYDSVGSPLTACTAPTSSGSDHSQPTYPTSNPYGSQLSMPAPNFIPPRPSSRGIQQLQAQHPGPYDFKLKQETTPGQLPSEQSFPDHGYYSTGSASGYTGSRSSHYGSSTNLSSPPDHNQASAKEKVLNYLSNNIPPETPDFELDNYQNGQYTMDTPLVSEPQSAVSSAPSSPPQHLAKRARVIQSGSDLLEEMRDRYSFVKGADMYAQPNKPVPVQRQRMATGQQNAGYNFSMAAGNGQTPQVPNNFNFSETAQRPSQQGQQYQSQYMSSQQQQNYNSRGSQPGPGGMQQPQGMPNIKGNENQHGQFNAGSQKAVMPNIFGPFAQGPAANQGMYGSCPNLTSPNDNSRSQSQNLNSTAGHMNRHAQQSLSGSQSNMGPPTMPPRMTPGGAQTRDPSPLNRQFPQQVVSAPNSPAKFVQQQPRQGNYNQSGGPPCRSVLFRPISVPSRGSSGQHPQQMMNPQANSQYDAPDQGPGVNMGQGMPIGMSQPQHQQYGDQGQAMQMRHGHQMNPQQPMGGHMMPTAGQDGINPQQQMPSNQMNAGGQYPRPNQGMPGPGMRPNMPSIPSTEVPLSQNGFMQSIMDDRSSAFRGHPLFPLLRDLIIADMNFHTPSFPFQLIANLPIDFDRLLNNYLTRNPPQPQNNPNHDAVQGVIMDALKYAHSALIEKIQGRKQREGYKEPDRPLSAIEDFCERFDRAVKNTMKPPMGDIRMGGGHGGHGGMPPGPSPHGGNHFENPHAGMPPPPGPMSMHGGPHTPMQPSHMGMPGQANFVGGLRQFHERQTHSLPASPRKFVRHLSHDGYTSDNLSDSSNNSNHDHQERKTQPTQGKNKVLPKEAVNLMLDWLRANQDNPYPNDDEKEMLIQKTKLTINQINYWFTNARRRILPKWALQRYMDQQQKQKDLDQQTPHGVGAKR